MLNKKSIDDINVSGKRVLVRCDFNVPLKDGQITDENRLVAALPTIKKLIADGVHDIRIEEIAVSMGMKTLQTSCLNHIVRGETTISEFVRVLGPVLD